MTTPISPEGTVVGGGDTPRTDSVLIDKLQCSDGGDHECTVYPAEEIVDADFARTLERELATLPALKQRMEELEKMLADTEDALEWHAANEARFWGIEDVHGYAKAAKNLLIKVKQALTPKDKATE